MALTWNDLFTRGSIVDLHFGYWRARISIKPEDFGIQSTDDVRKALSLGCHRLAPRQRFEEIHRIGRGAYERVQQLSMPFGLIVGARYVPEGTLPRLLEDLERAKGQFDEAVAGFLADYEDIKADMLPTIRGALAEAAKTPEAAEIAFDRLRTEYPSREDVARRFVLEWSVYAIAGPQSVAAGDALKAETGQVRDVVQQMVRRLRDEANEKLADVIRIAARGGKLPEPTIQSARDLIQRLEAMNILGDVELSRGLRTFRELIERAATAKVDSAFHTTLVDVRDQLTASAREAQQRAVDSLTKTGQRRIKV